MNKMSSNVACAGMDVHYKFSNVTFRAADGRIVSRQWLDHPDRKALAARLRRWPEGIPVVMEASFGWGWLSDMVEAAGLEVHLSNCYKVEQMRFRGDLVASQTEVKNRIHALFHRHGIFHEFSDLFGGEGRRFLTKLCIEGSPYLSAEALQAFRGQVRLLDHLRWQLADVARVLRKQLAKTPLIRQLKTINGFGLILSHVLAAEIGQIERFRNDKALASYCLLAPRSNDTGQEDPNQSPKGRHLGLRGNRTLKWAFLEAARGAVRSGGRWRAMYDRVTCGGTRDRNRGYIKVARALVKVVYVVWAKGVDYQPNPPARPGFKIHKNTSRSGTGQLLHPMVHA